MASAPSFESEFKDNRRLTLLSKVEIEIDDDTVIGDSSSVFCFDNETLAKVIGSTAGNDDDDDDNNGYGNVSDERQVSERQGNSIHNDQGRYLSDLKMDIIGDDDVCSGFDSDLDLDNNKETNNINDSDEAKGDHDKGEGINETAGLTTTLPNTYDLDDKINAILGKEHTSARKLQGYGNNSSSSKTASPCRSVCDSAFTAPALASNSVSTGTTRSSSSSSSKSVGYGSVSNTVQISPNKTNAKSFLLHRYVPSSAQNGGGNTTTTGTTNASTAPTTPLLAPTSPFRPTFRRQRATARALTKQQQQQQQQLGSIVSSNSNSNSNNNINIIATTSIDTTVHAGASSASQELRSAYRSDSQHSVGNSSSLNSNFNQFTEEKKTQNDIEEDEDDNDKHSSKLQQLQNQKQPQSPSQLHVSRRGGTVLQDDDLDRIDEIVNSRSKGGNPTTSVLYNEGATPLFKAIEEQDWKQVERICSNEPNQASIWVISTGTVQTTFNWSLWKRLPIHELCRRNPPVQALYSVINAFPDGCRAVTQFGELPLHLAVECGASSTIVTALITANWRGVFHCDQVGRTPIDVFRDTEILLDHTEYTAVQNAFDLSTRTYNEIQTEQEQEVVLLRQQHNIGLQAIRDQHDNDLIVEQEQHEKLVRQINGLQKVVQTLNMKVTEQSNVIKHQGTIQQQRELDYMTLFAEKDRYKYELQKANEQNDTLQGLIAKYQQELTSSNEQVSQLQDNLKDIVQFQTSVLQQQSARTTARLELALQSYNDMTDAIDDHTDHLKSLLQQFVLPIPKSAPSSSSSPSSTHVVAVQSAATTTNSIASPQKQPISSKATTALSTPTSTASSAVTITPTTIAHPSTLSGGTVAVTD
jgi:hypothetical protein